MMKNIFQFNLGPAALTYYDAFIGYAEEDISFVKDILTSKLRLKLLYSN